MNLPYRLSPEQKAWLKGLQKDKCQEIAGLLFSKFQSPVPEIEKDKHIQELEDENRQLKLQISALKKELSRINKSK